MLFKKQIMGLIAIVFVAAAITGCTTVGAKDGAVVASYTQGTLNETELNAHLVKTAGMQGMLDLVDRGILDVVEPVTDVMTAAVDENIASIKTQYQDNFEETLKMNGFDSEADLKNVMILEAQRSEYINKYITTTLLTEDEIKAYYDGFEPQIQASHILISPADDSEAAQAAAEKQAIDLTKRINAGEDFAALASEFSADPGSGANGGDLGLFGKGAMVPEFEDAAYALKIGEVTKIPVKTQFGYHIIKRTGGAEKTTLEEMKVEIEKSLAGEKLQADPSLASKALIKLRADNGLEIKQPIVAAQYKLFTEGLTQ